MVLSIEECINFIKVQTAENFPHLPSTNFQPGLTEDQITEFETKHDVKLPEDVKEYLSSVNGEGTISEGAHDCQAGVYLGLVMMSLEVLEREIQVWREEFGETP